MAYKHDDVDVIACEKNKAGHTVETPWPLKEIPTIGDIVFLRGKRFMVRHRIFNIPKSQDDRHSIKIMIE